MNRLLFSIFLLTILLVSTAFSAIDTIQLTDLSVVSNKIYVSANNGTDLESKIENATEGQTIVIPAGNYLLNGYTHINADNISIRGATGNPEDVVVRSLGFESCVDADQEMLIFDASNVTIADLTLTESRCHALKFGTGNNIIMHNLIFKIPGQYIINIW